MKNKTTAIILALFLGGIGLHKFYLDKPFQGLLYLVFCFTFIPMFVSFIEALSYMIQTEEDWNLNYNPKIYIQKKSDMKRCTECAEEILLAAKKCKHCGSIAA